MAAWINKQWKNILGMNSRMVDYIVKANSPESIRIANNKLATKKALQKNGLGTPRLFSIVRNRSELKNFRWTKLPSSFVLKPNSSSGGGGIVVIFGRNKKGNWVKANKSEVFIPDLRKHIMDILDGDFSKGNVPDTAFFEQRVKIHADLKPYCIKGIPDIRIILYNQVPVMAMLRLPTEESAGRANLHMGGIGVGIDLATGITTTAIQHRQQVDILPHNRLRIAGLQIPQWDDVLLLASRASLACGLNYVGVDIAIDREDGPLVLEVNARPGLDIQFANLAPLKSRLQRVEGLKLKGIEKKIQLAKHLFGAEVEQELDEIAGHTILGIEEQVIILDHEGKQFPLLAKVDTGAYRTTIDESIAKKLGVDKPVILHKGVRGALGKQTRPVVSLSLILRKKHITTEVSLIDRSHMKYGMILGRRDLKGFFVNPSKFRQK
jgi:alpha-L-glutamate ligase-like protein